MQRPMPTPIDAFRVLIAGGGVAGLEGLLAIRELTARPPHVEVLAPETEFSLPPARGRRAVQSR